MKAKQIHFYLNKIKHALELELVVLGKLYLHIVLNLWDCKTIYVLDATVETYELRSFDGEQSLSHEASLELELVVLGKVYISMSC